MRGTALDARWVRLVHVAFVVALTAAAATLLIRFQSVPMDDHERARRVVRDLQAAEQSLAQEVLRFRQGLLHHYDSIDAIQRQIAQTVPTIHGVERHSETLTPELGLDFDMTLSRYAAAVAVRGSRIERFKSNNAILSNSVGYYSANLGPLIQRLGTGTGNHDLLIALQVSVNGLAELYLAGPGKAAAATRLQVPRAVVAAAPIEVRNDLSNLTTHLAIIVSHKAAVDGLVSELLSGREQSILAEAADVNFANLAELRANLRVRTLILFVFSIITVAYVGFLISRMVVARRSLHQANAMLEQRVEERTAGLRAEIAERERTAAELHESETRLARVLEIAPDAMLLIDRDFHVRLYNLGAEAIFGYTTDEAIGCSIEMLIADWHERIHADVVASLSTSDGPVQKISDGQVVGRHKNGAVFPAAVSVSKIIHNGEAVLFVIARDISDRIQAEQDVLAAKEHAEIANRSKSQFLANMSHELRTPLNAVIGFAEVIEAETFGPVGNSRYVEYVGDIRESGQHLLSLINDILDLSKIEAGHAEIYEEPVRIASIVGSTLLVVKERAGLAGVALHTEIPDDLPNFLGDERKLKQILINLITNSVKFTEPGGRVVIAAAADPATGFTLSVADTGIGIAPEDIPRALASFQQVENTLNRRQDGTGLGLPLTVALVELHGGKLHISSEPGVGTTITAHFPPHRIVAARAGQPQSKRAKA